MAEAGNSIGELILLISPGFGMTGYEDEREYSDRLQSGYFIPEFAGGYFIPEFEIDLPCVISR